MKGPGRPVFLTGMMGAGKSTVADRARILIGKPPISVRRAIGLTLGALAGRLPRG